MIENFDWTTVTPAAIAVGLLAFGLEWFPKLESWWGALNSAKKARIMAGLILLISAASVLGKCYLWGDVCPANWWATFGALGVTFLLAGAVSQGVYGLSRRENFREDE
jgi:hypothetical protein